MSRFYVLRMQYTSGHLDSQLSAAHRRWVERQYEAGIFLVSGPVVEGTGGIALATGCSRDRLDAKLSEDPVVVAQAGIYEVAEVEATLCREDLGWLFGAESPEHR